MTIKKYKAKTEQEARQMAVDDLGENVVILSTKAEKPRGIANLFFKSKYVVTAAVDDVIEKSNEQSVKKSSTNLKADEFLVPSMPSKTVNKEENEVKKEVNEVKTNQTVKPEILSESKKTEDEVLTERIAKLSEMIEKMQEESKEKKAETEKKETKETKTAQVKKEETKKANENEEEDKSKKYNMLIRKQLIENEVDEQIADTIMNEVEKSVSTNASIDQILASVYQKIILKIGKPYLIDKKEKTRRTKYIFFIGSTGVGKTTTIAKLAAIITAEDKNKVALLSADTYRMAAVEQLRTYANIMGLPLDVIYEASELKDKIDDLEKYDYCLVDTAGRSHKNEEQIEDIKKLLDQIPISDRQVYLVLNAGTKYSDLKDIAKVYSKLTDYSIIFTKLDETSSLGAMLNMRIKTDCPLSYVTWGQNVPNDIGEVDPQKIAKGLLSNSK